MIKRRINEEQLISRYFCKSKPHPNINLGIGDDAAIINVSDECLAVATDTLVEGVHFEAGFDANCIGHKALAVNLSDLAAMGAAPRWALLALTVPNADTDWLEAFSDGFFRLANQYRVSLIGGDTTRGAITITVQLIGTLGERHILRRDSAQAGEGIYVTGRLADTALAALFAEPLKSYSRSFEQCTERMRRPVARVAEGLLLARYASAAIDISDGIFKDLSRILSASNVGAEIEITSIPTIPEIGQCCPSLQSRLEALSYGEDYELLFTLDDKHFSEVLSAFDDLGTNINRIGTIGEEPGLKCLWRSQEIELPQPSGYEHFG